MNFDNVKTKIKILSFCAELATGSRVALKGVALLSGTPKLRSAEGVPLIF